MATPKGDIRVLFLTIALMTSSIFVTMKADGDLPAWTWWDAFLPLILCASICIYFALAVVARLIVAGRHGHAFGVLGTNTATITPLFISLLLLVARIAGNSELSYWLVFVPVFVMYGIGLIGACLAGASDDD
eukprot:TRINITY_DN15175_c0_g1_i1.p1 TRINITY_DN15175_c0_g1~~TRINITY_DN15175_c0_g1_i1.p1  ORF type:complete len:142 (+),score=18.33 TRINITY_DN15175_c0_g1_i1:31-426(+)